MSSKSQKREPQVQTADRPAIRKAYSPPTVTPYGDLHELTHGVSGTPTDGDIGSK